MALERVPGPQTTKLGSSSYKHKEWHAHLTEVRYAHPDGNNSDDGMTWGTAKKDVVSAYDALPVSGGEVRIASETFWDSVNTDRGLWLLGSADPGYNGGAPTGGWRVRKRCLFKGVGGNLSTPTGHAGPVSAVFGGSNSDRAKPAIWIAGTGGNLQFENIHTQYHAVAWRMGVKSDQSGVLDSSGILFRNCSENVQGTAGNGPGVELGYMFWLFFYDCSLQGNTTAYTLTAATRAGAVATFTTSITHFLAVGDTVYVTGVTPSGYNGTWTVTSVTSTTFVVTLAADPGGSGSVFGTAEPVKNYRRAAIAHNSDRFVNNGSTASHIYFENSNFNDGGFLYQPNGINSWGNIVMRGVTHEGNFVGPEPPTLFVRTRTYGDIDVAAAGSNILVENLNIADATGHTVEVEGTQTDPGLVTVVNASAAGNVTQLGFVTSRRQVGIDSGAFIGHDPGHNRVFSPANCRYVNVVSHTLSGGSWTTGVAAPDGTTNASSITATEITGFFGQPSMSVGDWVVAGIWHRFITLTTMSNEDWPIIDHSSAMRFDAGPNNYFSLDQPGRWDDGAWTWLAEAHKVTTAGIAADFRFRFKAGTGNTVAYFAPVLFRIPVADGLRDEEVFELVRHLQTYPSTAPVGAISTLAGQKLLSPAGIGVGNSAAATTPGSVVKKMEVFSETGASLGFVPIYNAIT